MASLATLAFFTVANGCEWVHRFRIVRALVEKRAKTQTSTRTARSGRRPCRLDGGAPPGRAGVVARGGTRGGIHTLRCPALDAECNVCLASVELGGRGWTDSVKGCDPTFPLALGEAQFVYVMDTPVPLFFSTFHKTSLSHPHCLGYATMQTGKLSRSLSDRRSHL